jgi:hypothetical protein
MTSRPNVSRASQPAFSKACVIGAADDDSNRGVILVEASGEQLHMLAR